MTTVTAALIRARGGGGQQRCRLLLVGVAVSRARALLLLAGEGSERDVGRETIIGAREWRNLGRSWGCLAAAPVCSDGNWFFRWGGGKIGRLKE